MKPEGRVRQPMHAHYDLPVGTYITCTQEHPDGCWTVGKVYKIYPSHPKLRARFNCVRIRDNKREKTDFNFSVISPNYIWEYFRPLNKDELQL